MVNTAAFTESDILNIVKDKFTHPSFRKEFSEFETDYKHYDQATGSPGGCKPCAQRSINTRQQKIAKQLYGRPELRRRLESVMELLTETEVIAKPSSHLTEKEELANVAPTTKEHRSLKLKVAENFKRLKITKSEFLKLLLDAKVQDFFVKNQATTGLLAEVNKKISQIGIHHVATKYSVDALYDEVWSNDKVLDSFIELLRDNSFQLSLNGERPTFCKIIQQSDITKIELEINKLLLNSEIISVNLSEVNSYPTATIIYR